jgi:hypothetical protein
MAKWFAIASGLMVLIGAPFYLFDILKGKTKPERTTWLIWSIQGLIAFGAQFKLGAHWSLLYVGLEALGNIIVYLLALRFGVGGWHLRDKYALVIAAIGVIASVALKDPVLALFGVVLADFAGVALTLRKAYLDPSSETALTWFALGISSALAAASVGHWYFQLLLYPIYLSATTFAVPIAQALGLLRKKSNRSVSQL